MKMGGGRLLSPFFCLDCLLKCAEIVCNEKSEKDDKNYKSKKVEHV